MPLNDTARFSQFPQAEIQRSRFKMDKRRLTSFNVGDVVPIYLEDVLPGDTFSVDTSKVVRLPTLLTPMMDNIYLDTYYFFVPSRLLWCHWPELMGENTTSAWVPNVEYEVPVITAPEGGWQHGTIADYLGIPTCVDGISPIALPFRAYALVCQEWFRDQNLTDPLVIPDDDSNIVGSNGDNYITDVAKGGKPFRACKYHDLFTSCLPSPQKGNPVSISIGQVQDLPVIPLNDVPASIRTMDPLRWRHQDGGPDEASTGAIAYDATRNVTTQTVSTGALNSTSSIIPSNLWAVNYSGAQYITINELRTAFAIQRFLERDARGGTRYIEMIRSHFGVVSPDSRLQRPEYLGGNRLPLTVSQVVQSSGTSQGSTPQGTVAGYSLTTDKHSDFTKSFSEHGYVLGVAVARYDHTYQQGMRRLFSRRSRYDYYWPVFANLGEQAIYNKEIYAQGTAEDNEVFGYNEAWSQYRVGINEVTGMMRSNYPQSLDCWHLADDYASCPRLSDGWIREDKATVDRVLTVGSDVSNQVLADFYFSVAATRPMPLYSIPGLIDHH